MARFYNKRVDPKALEPGDLVLKQIRPGAYHPGGKFRPNWEGPFIVKKVFSRGGVRLSDLEGNEFSDRKSTRLNSSHGYISYAVFCLKKKKISLKRKGTEVTVAMLC